MSDSMLSESITPEEPADQVLEAGTDATESTLTNQLPDQFKDAHSLAKFKSVEDLAKSYMELESNYSSRVKLPTEQDSKEAQEEFYNKISGLPNVVIKPTEDTEEAMNLFHRSLGVPEKPDGYMLPEELELDHDTKTSLFKMAHNAKMTNDQVRIMAESKINQLKEQGIYQETLRKDSENLLREKWGTDFDARINGAKVALNHYKEKYGDMVDRLLEAGADNNAAFVAMLSEIGSNLHDNSTLGQGSVEYGMTAEDAVIKLAELRSNPAYGDPNHPDHKIIQQQAYKLQRIISG